MHISLIQASAFDVTPIQEELAAHPQLWNTVKLRTEHPQSPHREVDDIWVRYNAQENYHGDMQAFNDVHTPSWYSSADRLPAAKFAAQGLSTALGGTELGAVLITRIPPGKQVYPHVDGGWHARTFEKYCICVKANESQAFCFKDEQLHTRDGDLFWFDNAYPHWVTNPSDEERISLIVCIRRMICQ